MAKILKNISKSKNFAKKVKFIPHFCYKFNNYVNSSGGFWDLHKTS